MRVRRGEVIMPRRLFKNEFIEVDETDYGIMISCHTWVDRLSVVIPKDIETIDGIIGALREVREAIS